MIIAAPKTGIIKANILITRNKAMDRNGTNIFLYFKPGIPKVLLVINKFVKAFKQNFPNALCQWEDMRLLWPF